MFVRFILVLFLFNAVGCVSTSAKRVNNPHQMISIPDARLRIFEYYEGGQYARDVEAKTREIEAAVKKAIASGVKYPAVIMSMEDVLVSTYNVRKKQGFADNSCARKALDYSVILGILPAIKPSVKVFESLLSRGIPVFIISHRPENLRVSILENLAGAGYSGWSGLYLLPPNHQDDSSGFYEEVRKGLHRTGINIVVTVGVIPSDIAGEQTGTPILYPNYIYSSR
ncbi:HAD family acid phosphatase [Maridesulfovibrio ferrireducens]|uniref:HAD family acid phosphatase n=1 Tax=Maridesulfovibrio ferrireducens TaxID=246191 RepID=UPI0026ECFEDA|nr:HAD family acid phosphatase [Maridesulfovibrio ferrireducens]